MNWNRIKVIWNQFKSNIKLQWCKLLTCKSREAHGISGEEMAVWQEHQERKDHERKGSLDVIVGERNHLSGK